MEPPKKKKKSKIAVGADAGRSLSWIRLQETWM